MTERDFLESIINNYLAFKKSNLNCYFCFTINSTSDLINYENKIVKGIPDIKTNSIFTKKFNKTILDIFLIEDNYEDQNFEDDEVYIYEDGEIYKNYRGNKYLFILYQNLFETLLIVNKFFLGNYSTKNEIDNIIKSELLKDFNSFSYALPYGDTKGINTNKSIRISIKTATHYHFSNKNNEKIDVSFELDYYNDNFKIEPKIIEDNELVPENLNKIEKQKIENFEKLPYNGKGNFFYLDKNKIKYFYQEIELKNNTILYENLNFIDFIFNTLNFKLLIDNALLICNESLNYLKFFDDLKTYNHIYMLDSSIFKDNKIYDYFYNDLSTIDANEFKILIPYLDSAIFLNINNENKQAGFIDEFMKNGKFPNFIIYRNNEKFEKYLLSKTNDNLIKINRGNLNFIYGINNNTFENFTNFNSIFYKNKEPEINFTNFKFLNENYYDNSDINVVNLCNTLIHNINIVYNIDLLKGFNYEFEKLSKIKYNELKNEKIVSIKTYKEDYKYTFIFLRYYLFIFLNGSIFHFVILKGFDTNLMIFNGSKNLEKMYEYTLSDVLIFNDKIVEDEYKIQDQLNKFLTLINEYNFNFKYENPLKYNEMKKDDTHIIKFIKNEIPLYYILISTYKVGFIVSKQKNKKNKKLEVNIFNINDNRYSEKNKTRYSEIKGTKYVENLNKNFQSQISTIENNTIKKGEYYSFYTSLKDNNLTLISKSKGIANYDIFEASYVEKAPFLSNLLLNFEEFMNKNNQNQKVYFEKEKSSFYDTQTKYTMNCKKILLNSFEPIFGNNYNNCLDLSSGKGQDLNIYKRLNFITDITFIDNDYEALVELINRKNKIGLYKRNEVLQMDLNNSINFMNNRKTYNLVVCNLAIHYLTYNDKKLKNFYDLVDKKLNSKGIFIFIALDGKKVLNYLKENDIYRVDHYGLKIKNDEKIIEKNLQYYIDIKGDLNNYISQNKIRIKLPFSKNLYEENLVDFDRIKNKFRNFNVLEYNSLLSDYLINSNEFYYKLSEYDKEYVDFYSYMILQKN